MNPRFGNLFESLWSRPDPVLADAGVAGELLVAKIRLALAIFLLLIPLLNSLFFPVDPKEGLVGLSLTSGTFLLALTVYLMISRGYNSSWLRFASSAFDVTLVSSALVLFLLLNQPHTAVNSKVVFEGYFLVIGSASLRYDKRVCITTGLLAFAQYFAIVYFTASHWDLNNSVYTPYPYGLFSWSTQISRLIIMFTASALSIAVIDADRFKSLNDTHGHSAGDLVLRAIGSMLRESFRQSDTAGRYGGEEFIVILPETDMEAAQRKVERLREQVASTPIALATRGEKTQMTISAGLASFPQGWRGRRGVARFGGRTNVSGEKRRTQSGGGQRGSAVDVSLGRHSTAAHGLSFSTLRASFPLACP
jgi:diguanylate cyclase (GGDEF)-like protein